VRRGVERVDTSESSVIALGGLSANYFLPQLRYTPYALIQGRLLILATVLSLAALVLLAYQFGVLG
jgi:hypothetical protein